ncbi:MAG: D-glycero-beta-D-manno-heptose-7-phosphate kinase [Verrucomicrobiaceae bacterium]|nr:D-glycero-beta-D-manno-heptose-7-phosphate kinase [Verrucomicrobiaceae bacterium]
MDDSRFADLLTQFSRKSILVLGDVMLDRFIWGNVSRISPEAPVPVVHVQRESAYPGGAANVARNLLPFAGQVHVMGVLGPGMMGDLLRKNFEEEGLSTEALVVDEGYETIVKTRVVARSQQVVRIDRETPRSVSSRVVKQMKAHFSELLPSLDAIIIEDYAKGLLGQDFVDAVIAEAAEAGVPVTVDPNPNNPLSWRGVTAVKPNRIEAFQAAGLKDEGLGDDLASDPILLELGQRLHDLWDCQHLLITLSERGLVLLSRDEGPWHSHPRAREVFDVSGAGDTAIALFTLALCSGATAREAAHLSNHASSLVVGKVGTATVTPEELTMAISGDYLQGNASPEH